MKKMILVGAIASLIGSAYAADTKSSTSISDVRQKLKDSPASLLWITDFSTIRDDSQKSATNVDGVYNENIFDAGWALDENWSLGFENRIVIQNDKRTDDDAMWERSILKLSRSNVLNEKDHGVSLRLRAERRYLPDTGKKNSSNTRGHYRLSSKFGKTFSDKFSADATAYFALNDKRNNDIASTDDNYMLLITSQTFQATEKLSYSARQDFYKTNKQENDAVKAGKRAYDTQVMTLVIGADYAFNSDITAGVYAAADILNAHDGTFFARRLEEKTTLGVSATITAF